jgi:DNA-binding GntR family transcriptional regulator
LVASTPVENHFCTLYTTYREVVVSLSLHEDVSAAERVLTPAPPLPSSLAELAAEWITARIIAGDIRPGDKLTEGALAEAAGMSRSPIREALRALSSQGLVSVEPRRAATVALLSARDAADLYECRLLLEPRCMASASLEFGSEVGAELGDCIDQMSKATRQSDGHTYLDAVTRYNRALQECCPNRILASMTAAAQNSSLRYTTILVRSSQQYLMLSLANNMELHAAVSARDEDAVHEATSRVLTSARDQLLDLISSIPGGPRSPR